MTERASERGLRLSEVAVWLMAVLIAIVPLATANLTGLGIGRYPLLYDSIELPRLVLTCAAVCALWLMWWIGSYRTQRTLRYDLAWGLLFALAGWGVVSDLLSSHRALGVLGQSERLEGFVTLFGYALLYGAALQFVRGVRHVHRLVTGLGVAAFISAAYGLSQAVGFDPTSYVVLGYAFSLRRAFATFGNPDFLAGLFVIALPCTIALAWAARHVAWRSVWWLGSAGVAAALVLTFTRGAWLAVFVELGLAGWAWFRRGMRVNRALLIGAVCLVLVVLVAATFSLRNPSETNVLGRVADIGQASGSSGERLLVLQAAASAIAARPLFGYGPDSFLAAFRLNRPAAYATTFSSVGTVANAHSWPVQIAATLGLPAALLLVAAVVLALWRARDALFTRQDARFDPVFASVWLGCAGFSVFMLTSVAVHGSTTPFWLLLGALGAPSAAEASVPRPVALAGAGICTVLSALVLAAGVSFLAADATYLRSRLAFRGFEAGSAAPLAEQALRENPLSIKYARGAAEAAARQAEAALSGGVSGPDVASVSDAADQAFDRALALDPADYATLAWKSALFARVAAETGDARWRTIALEAADRAAALDRQHAEVAHLLEGDTSAAASNRAASVPPLP